MAHLEGQDELIRKGQHIRREWVIHDRRHLLNFYDYVDFYAHYQFVSR